MQEITIIFIDKHFPSVNTKHESFTIMEESLETPQSSNNKKIAVALLILTTVLWGSTFILTRNIIKNVPIFFFLGFRFLFALLIFLPFLPRLKDANKKLILYGFLAGTVYFIAIAIQTIGLQTTTAGKAGFITGLNAIMVPFLAWKIYKKPANRSIWIALVLAVIGMALLMLEGESGVVIGDILILFCAFGFAIYIIMVDRDVKVVDIYLYLIVQLLVIVILCFTFSILLQESYDLSSANLNFWLIIIYMGCIASGLTFLFQNWGQKQVEPSQTAIIFTLEPVFAVLFASFLIGNETLTWQMLIGCGLIFIAILITVMKNQGFPIESEEKMHDSKSIL